METKQPRVSGDGLSRETKYRVGEFVRFIYSRGLVGRGTIIKIEKTKSLFSNSYYHYYIHERLEMSKVYNMLYKVEEENIFSDSLDENPHLLETNQST